VLEAKSINTDDMKTGKTKEEPRQKELGHKAKINTTLINKLLNRNN
jgi:hypothetical protein